MKVDNVYLKWHEGSLQGAVVLFANGTEIWLRPKEYYEFMIKYLDRKIPDDYLISKGRFPEEPSVELG